MTHGPVKSEEELAAEKAEAEAVEKAKADEEKKQKEMEKELTKEKALEQRTFKATSLLEAPTLPDGMDVAETIREFNKKLLSCAQGAGRLSLNNRHMHQQTNF